MIESIALKYFRKHEDLSLNFGEGLNVLRGANEVGKTTIIEGIGYALYGAAFLRDTVADTVTWGHKETELATSLVIAIGGRRYTFTRGPKGAEVNYDGGKVTGQKEVTKYATELLGADVKTASALMMASQSDLRGALDTGATAVSVLMAKLANSDVIDRILENANQRLLLGSDEPVRTRLATAAADAETARAAQVDPKVITQLQEEVATLTSALSTLEAQAAEVLQPAMVAADELVTTAKQRASSRQHALDAVASTECQLAAEVRKLTAAQADAAKQPDAKRILTLRNDLAEIATAKRHTEAYNLFLDSPSYPDVAWDNDFASFEAEVQATTAARDAARASIQELAGQIRQAQAGRITNGKCPTCGSLKTSDEHVAKVNAAIDATIAGKRAEEAPLRAALQGHESSLATLMGVQAAARRIDAHAAKFPGLVEIDTSTYPAKVAWKGKIPGAVDAGTRAAELATLEKADRDATQAQGRVAAHQVGIQDLKKALADCHSRVDALPAIDLDPLVEAYDEAYRVYAENASKVRDIRPLLDAARHTLADAERGAAEAAGKLAAALARIEECETDIKKLAFNNSLVKKLRTLKPAITDFLWNSVLSAVSNFFSTMRGEQSVVTKDGDGFRVNGKSVQSLSGSTLDVLALAIRVALSKTFVPHAGFLQLDEPAHGCDAARTAGLLGFLASAGFHQIILASHDEMSESVANNVLLIGE